MESRSHRRNRRNVIETLVVYVCPNPQCSNYYGSSSMGRLEKQWNRALKGEKTHKRSQCPNCKSERIRRYARLIPTEEVSDALKAAQSTRKTT